MEIKPRNIDFVNTLRYLIDSTGLSAYKISVATNITYGSLQNYLKGTVTPSVDALIKLADYFAVPLDYLVGRCSEEDAKEIAENYPSRFMELRRAPYEAYLIGRTAKIGSDGIGESQWPYNLMDDVCGEPWVDVLTDDQIAGINAAIAGLTPREQEYLLLYYRDGMTLDSIGSKQGLTRERVRQIIAKAVRKLRAPHRKNLMMCGVKGAEERSYLTHYRNELDKEAAALQAYEKQLAEKKVQLCDAAMGMSAPDMPPSSWGMDLCEMDLSVRSYNVLHRAGCWTLGDVIKAVESGKMLNIRNMGRKSAEEILEKIYCLTGKRYTLTGEEVSG